MEIQRGDIYYADLNPIQGSEQGGVRPVLILQNNIGNKHSQTTIVAATTSRCKKRTLPTHVDLVASGLPLNSIILLEQIRTMDKSRLKEYVGQADEQTMQRVEQALTISLGLTTKKEN